MSKFIVWVMLFLTTNAPPGRPQFIPDAIESRDAAQARYESIAKDLEEVVQSEPTLFQGQNAQARTAAVLLSVMFFESSFRRDVDLGVGPHARGDGGRSWCLLQQNVGKGRTLPWNTKYGRFANPVCKDGQVSTKGVPCDPADEVHPGWTGPELVADRKNCMRAGLRNIRRSFAACGRMPVADWLRSYASGSCAAGGDASARRMNFAMRWFSSHRPDPDNLLFQPPAPPAVDLTAPIAMTP